MIIILLIIMLIIMLNIMLIILLIIMIIILLVISLIIIWVCLSVVRPYVLSPAAAVVLICIGILNPRRSIRDVRRVCASTCSCPPLAVRGPRTKRTSRLLTMT